MTLDEERELEKELELSRKQDEKYEKAVKYFLFWIAIGFIVLFSVISLLFGCKGTVVKTTGGFSLKGTTVAEMVTDYERKSGKTLSTWFKTRISEKCAGKERTEQERIINEIGATAPR